MLMDQNLRFSAAQAIGASAVSANYYDELYGALIATAGAYQASSGMIIGNAASFGEDLGIGRGPGTPKVVVTTKAGVIAAGTSLSIAFQGAPDVTATNTYAGLTFTTYIQTGVIPIASILASSRIASFDWPKRGPGLVPPRFVQLSYVVVGGPFTGLSVDADITVGPDDATGTLGQFPANY